MVPGRPILLSAPPDRIPSIESCCAVWASPRDFVAALFEQDYIAEDTGECINRNNKSRTFSSAAGLFSRVDVVRLSDRDILRLVEHEAVRLLRFCPGDCFARAACVEASVRPGGSVDYCGSSGRNCCRSGI